MERNVNGKGNREAATWDLRKTAFHREPALELPRITTAAAMGAGIGTTDGAAVFSDFCELIEIVDKCFCHDTMERIVDSLASFASSIKFKYLQHNFILEFHLFCC
ncbi:hypothetical protein AHAS_Ahas13G0313300 [Arachis hypogaea]